MGRLLTSGRTSKYVRAWRVASWNAGVCLCVIGASLRSVLVGGLETEQLSAAVACLAARAWGSGDGPAHCADPPGAALCGLHSSWVGVVQHVLAVLQ